MNASAVTGLTGTDSALATAVSSSGLLLSGTETVTVTGSASVANLNIIDGATTGAVTYGTVADLAATLVGNSGGYVSGNHNVVVTNAATIAQLTTIDAYTRGTLTYSAVSDTALNLISDRLTNIENGTYVTDSVSEVYVAKSATISVSDALLLAGVAGIRELAAEVRLTISDTAYGLLTFATPENIIKLGASQVTLSAIGSLTQVDIDTFMALGTDTGVQIALNNAFSLDTISAEQAIWAAEHGTTATLTIYGPVDEGVEATDLINVNATSTLSEANLLKAYIAAGYLNLSYDGSLSNAGLIINMTGAGATYIGRELEITGGNFNDSITGTALTDTINGASGNDTIKGGAGADILTGGVGADIFTYARGESSALSSGTLADMITDFGVGADKIRYASSLTKAVNSTGGDLTISNGIATFTDAGDLATHLTAIAARLGTTAAGNVVEWSQGSDTYVFISDGVNGLGASDVLIELVGVAPSTLNISGTDITSI